MDGSPRRSLFQMLAGAALAGLVGRPEPVAAGERCRHGQERCGGKCRATCTDVMVRDRRTCKCECPSDMKRCGRTCVGEDRCCPGEKECGGGCIADSECCPHTHRECPDGSCLEKGSGACCPDVEKACAAAPEGCCNSFAGEECSDDGCCNTLLGMAVCGGKCVDTEHDDNNCGACGTTCRSGCQRCEGGTCVATGSCCQSGQLDCGGRCINPKWDLENCGGCGVRCGSCEYCDNGTCRRRCAPGWDCCGSIFCCEQPSAGATTSETRRVRQKSPKRAGA